MATAPTTFTEHPRFLARVPAVLGLLMIVAGMTYWINSFRLFLVLPIPYLPWVTLIAELSLAMWLLVIAVNEAKWRAHAQALQTAAQCAKPFATRPSLVSAFR